MLRLPSLFAALTFGLILLVSPSSRADVVNSPPDTCPPGGTPSTCHGGPHCTVDPECTDASCPAGEECVTRRLCFGRVGCAGMLAPGEDPAQYERDTLERLCSEDEADGCCRERKVCVTVETTNGTAGGGNGTAGAPGAAGNASTGSAGGTSTGSNLQPVTPPKGSCAVSSPRAPMSGHDALFSVSAGLLLVALRRRRQ